MGEPDPTKVIINTDGISDEQKETEKFRQAYREMRNQLAAPGFAHVLCCHEAAHLYYFTMAGTKEYDPFPARLEYDPKIDDYGGTLAAVKIHELSPPAPENTWSWLRIVAKAHAAGGVIARMLMPGLQDVGDQDDKERFIRLCERIKTDNPCASIDPEALWKQAQDAVLQEFSKIPNLLSKLEKFAEEELAPQLGLA